MAEQINYEVNINTGTSDKSINQIIASIDNLDNKLGELYKEQDRLKAQRDQFAKGTILYDKWNKKLQEVSKEVRNVSNNYDKLSNTLNTKLSGGLNTIQDLEEAQSYLNEQLKSVSIGTDEYRNLAAQLGNVNRELKNTELGLEVLDREQVGSAARSVAGGLVDIANGLTLIGLEGESMEKMVETMARVEGISYIVGGAIDTWSDGLKLVKNLQDKAAASTSILTAATTAQEAATGKATITQRVLNLVMSANPAFLLLTAITALAAGFYLFSKRSDEAAAAEKKRADATKQANEEAKKQKDYITSNSNAFVTLVSRLKATNVNTKERKELMKEINDKYGITLNNIKDEAKFQETLNGHLIQYIAYQKLKFTLQKNEERQTENLVKQNKIVEDLNKELKTIGVKYDQFQDKFYNVKTGEETFLGNIRSQFGTFAQSIDVAFEKLESANERLEGYANTETYLTKQINNITKAGTIYVEQENKVQNTTKESTKNYADASKEVENLVKVMLELAKINEDIASFESQLNINSELKNQIDQIKNTGTYSSALLKQLIKEDYERKLTYINNRKEEELAEANSTVEKELINKKYYLEIRKLEEENTSFVKDKLKELEEAQEEYVNNVTKQQEDNNNKMQEDYEKRIEEIKSMQQLYKDFGDTISEIFVSSIVGSFEQINAAFESLQEKMFGPDGFFERFKAGGINSGLAITEALMVASESLSAFSQQKLQDQLSESQNYFDETQNQYAEALANREISQLEYDTKIRRLEQEKREKDKKADQDAFNRTKKLSIIQATIATAQAVLQAFQSGAAYPFVGPAIGAVYAGIAGAIGAAQIGIISSQQYRAARGGIVPGSKGSKDFDSVNALLAPGEVVINSRSAEMFPDLLSGINEAGGGVPLVPQNINNIKNGMDASSNNNNQTIITEAVISEQAVTQSLDNISRLKRKQRFS